MRLLSLFIIFLALALGSGLSVAYAAEVSSSRTLAFPGAEGFGSYSQGGKGGQILQVTNLSDDANQPGSLRWAVEQKGPRIVKFAVEGTIELTAPLVINHPMITIDGSTAPGKGITLKDGTLEINGTHDVIIRYLRIRPGDEAALKLPKKERHGFDAIYILNSSYVIVDHCSLSWSSDTVASVEASDHVTIQWCFLYEPLANPQVHIRGGKTMSHAHVSNVQGDKISYIKNLLAYYGTHGLQVDDNIPGSIEVVNNYHYGYYRDGLRLKPVNGNKSLWQVVNNVFERPLDDRNADIAIRKGGVKNPRPNKESKIYISGNLGEIRTDLKSDEWSGVSTDLTKKQFAGLHSEAPLFTSLVKPITTSNVKSMVMQKGGAILPRRDQNDDRLIRQIKTGEGPVVINSQIDVGGYREFAN